MDASEYLIEIDALDGNNQPDTLRLSTSGYVTGPTDSPANTVYEAGIDDPGMFTRHLYGQARTQGTAEAGYGSISLANADGLFDGYRDYAFDGREFRLYRLPSPRSDFSQRELLQRATIYGVESDTAWITLRLGIYDRRRDLDTALLTNRYGGTTTEAGPTADGNEDLRDTIKQKVWGRVFNIEGQPANPFGDMIQFSDGLVHSMQVYEGGVPFDSAGNFADLTALHNARTNGTIRPGQYGTSNSLGIAQMGWQPRYQITADVVEGATLADRYPGAVVQRILAHAGITEINAASFAALDAAAPYEVGVLVEGEQTVMSVVRAVLVSVGAYIIPNAANEFEVGRLAFSAPVTTYTEHDILTEGAKGTVRLSENPDTPNNVPAHSVVVKFRRVWSVMRAGDIAGCVDEDFRGFLKKEWRETRVESPSVKARHLKSEEIAVETLLTQANNAGAEAARWLGLYGVDREVITFSVPQLEAAELGQTVTIRKPRLGYENGRDMIVIGRDEDRRAERITLTCWG